MVNRNEEFDIPVDADVQLSEEELRQQMSDAGFHMNAEQFGKELAKAQEHDRIKQIKRINSIAEAVGAHLDSKKSNIGAKEIAVATISEGTNKPLEEEKARVIITDSGGTKYYIDVQLTENGEFRNLLLPPSLNPVRDEIQKIFDHMKAYGDLSPHSIKS